MTSAHHRRTAARTAARNFTKYRRWLDKDGVWRAASTHPLYNAWRRMISRCYKPGSTGFADYGGRGIAVYGPWREDPVAYYEWVARWLGPRDRRTLDRIQNDGNYEPGNLRWESATAQARNRRSRWPEWWRDCLCAFDCRELPGLCERDALPWEQAAAALAQEARRSRQRPHRPHLVEHVHTGNYDDCVACVRQDPYSWGLSDGHPRDAYEWCSVGRGLPYVVPGGGNLLIPVL